MTNGISSKGRPWTAPALLAATVVLLLIAAACGSTSDDSFLDTGTSPRTDTADEPTSSDQNDPATSESEANLENIAGGGQLDWNSLQGRDVVLWFWAPW